MEICTGLQGPEKCVRKSYESSLLCSGIIRKKSLIYDGTHPPDWELGGVETRSTHATARYHRHSSSVWLQLHKDMAPLQFIDDYSQITHRHSTIVTELRYIADYKPWFDLRACVCVDWGFSGFAYWNGVVSGPVYQSEQMCEFYFSRKKIYGIAS